MITESKTYNRMIKGTATICSNNSIKTEITKKKICSLYLAKLKFLIFNENNGISAGTYLVGDFTKAKFWTRKGMELKIWEQNEDDAINQLKTVTLYMRGTLVVKDADKLAFVTDTFADSITEITKV